MNLLRTNTAQGERAGYTYLKTRRERLAVGMAAVTLVAAPILARHAELQVETYRETGTTRVNNVADLLSTPLAFGMIQVENRIHDYLLGDAVIDTTGFDSASEVTSIPSNRSTAPNI